MTFSIVIPVYNAEKYLRQCLESVVNLSIPQGADLEVLLVENGSEDKSPDICDQYADKYGFVKSIHFGKIGAFAARREGMKAAGGDYIIFADADDLLAKDTVSAVYSFLAGTGDTVSDTENADILQNEKVKCLPDIILHNAAGIYTPSERMFGFSLEFEPGRIYNAQEKDAFYRVMCLNDSLNALWNKVISRELARRIISEDGTDDGTGKKSFNHGEDLLQTAEMLDKAESVVYVDEILYYYRDNTEGLTGSYHREFLENQVAAWSSFDKYAEKWTGNRYKDRISERKTLTCTIAVKSLVYSMLGAKEKKSELKRIMESPFYKEYALKMLPKWAPEEDIFIHDIMISDASFKKLIGLSVRYKAKTLVKKLLRKL